jgi:hypothetical protein
MPYSLLKRSPANIKRQVKPEGRIFDEGRYSHNQLFALTIFAGQISVWKSVAQIAHQQGWIAAHKNGADAPFAACDQNRA